MKLCFTPRAAHDLVEIAGYIRAENPTAALRIRDSILDSLQRLTQFPYMGRVQSMEGVRKLVVRKYPYLVYYTVDSANDQIVILTIQHTARERVYADH